MIAQEPANILIGRFLRLSPLKLIDEGMRAERDELGGRKGAVILFSLRACVRLFGLRVENAALFFEGPALTAFYNV